MPLNGNREYRSDVFSMLLEDKENCLNLYNAVNNTNYSDPNLIEICPLPGAHSITVRNDASFIIDNNISMYEHQSTKCPNMPLRFLFYISEILLRMIDTRQLKSTKRVMIPTPKFVVFYNGNVDEEEISIQRLSDSFINASDSPEIEISCIIYNINAGKNEVLLEKCQFLKEYVQYICVVRDNIAKLGYNNLEEAIKSAIDYCINHNILKNFLLNRRSEVEKVTYIDYTYEGQLALFEEEKQTEINDARNAGIEQGIAQSIAQSIERMLKKGKTADEIAEFCGYDLSLVKDIESRILVDNAK